MALPTIVRISRRVAADVDRLRFSSPITHVYNPLLYARLPHEEYLRRYTRRKPQVLLVGMNPGPWGMAQTGVPFGAVDKVRDWLGIDEPVRQPKKLHPKRPVLGFACERQEVSGQRVWGWASTRFKKPEAFSKTFFVWNYCPLVFYDKEGRNVTPDKLKVRDRQALFAACDAGLQRIAEHLEPGLAVGVGKFAEDRIRAALPGYEGASGRVLHPSPASPMANRGWAEQAEKQLKALGVRL